VLSITGNKFESIRLPRRSLLARRSVANVDDAGGCRFVVDPQRYGPRRRGQNAALRRDCLRVEHPAAPAYDFAMNEAKLLERISVDPKIFGGKPIIRGRRLAVEHVLGMLAAGDSAATILENYPWLEADDIQACLLYARRLVAHEHLEPMFVNSEK
jgi:uncharacterized protein (DUF433 family)